MNIPEINIPDVPNIAGGMRARSATFTARQRSNSSYSTDGTTGILPGFRRHSISIPVLVISDSDHYDVGTSSGLKYGKFVDWEKMPAVSSKSCMEPLPSDPKVLKSMARAGCWSKNHTVRAKAYNHIIRSIRCRAVTPDDAVYRDISGKLFGQKKVSTHPFPQFMKESQIPMYCLNKGGLNAVKKVLVCLENQFPDITYCPVLPAIVSLLLHYSEDEAECFQNACKLIACNDPDMHYVDQTFLAYQSSCMTFGDLAKKYCHGAHKLIATTDHNRVSVYSEWMMWLFGGLPFEYATRVFDVYLLEGFKVLYRVALALLKQYRVSVTSRESEITDLQQDIQSFVASIAHHLTVDKFLEKAFSIRLFSGKEISLLQIANRKALAQKGITHTQRRQSVHMAIDLQRFSSGVVTAQEMRIIWSWIPERFALFHPTLLFTTSEHGYSLQTLYSRVEGYEPTVLLFKTLDEEVSGAFLSSDWSERNKNGGKDSFFGTGECFVFTLRPEMERYEWMTLHPVESVSEEEFPKARLRSRSFTPSGSRPDTSASSLSTAGTSQDSSLLTVPLTEPRPAHFRSVPHLPTKTASMFMAGSRDGIIIGGGGGQALYIDGDLHRGSTQHCDTFNNPPLCKESFQIQLLEVWGIHSSVQNTVC
ncbi:TBC1 domain family member 24-like [Polyodon spathula]|uniref:TBC1 domain family member 24-like n=1 Tax=Polyodon spathula TaxID=7913 RepID=UPI001B7E0D6B|nr:TBC1 domain family member 24-like [Polyodon spathula]